MYAQILPDPETHPLVAGLRELADLLEEHPDLIPPYCDIDYHWFYDTAAEMASVRRQLGGQWDKKPTGNYYGLDRQFGPRVNLSLNVAREEACEKVPTGGTTVVKVATAWEEREEPEYEWVCSPLLSEVK